MRGEYQRGISLLEVLLVLTVAAAIVAGAITYFSQTLRSNKVAQAVNLIQQINKAGYEWLQIPDSSLSSGNYQTDFTNLANSTDGNGLYAFQSLGLMGCENNSCFTNPWNGKTSVTTGAPAKYMLIILTNIPDTDCKNLQEVMRNIAPQDPQILQQNLCSSGSQKTSIQSYRVYL